MVEYVRDSFNLYIDTDAGVGTDNMVDFNVNLNTAGLSCQSNEYFKFSLLNFSMPKVWTNINSNNNKFYIKTNYQQTLVSMKPQNYGSLYDLSKELASLIGNTIVSHSQALGTAVTKFSITEISPASGVTDAGTSNNIISFNLTFQNASSVATDTLITSCLIQFFDTLLDGTFSSISNILGGERIIDNTNTTLSSYIVFIDTDHKIFSFKSYYPAQRTNTPYIYLRTDLATKALVSSSLDRVNLNKDKNDIHDSNIIAKILVDNAYCVLNPNEIGMYSFRVFQRNINQFRLFITDQFGKLLPAYNDNQNQYRYGNMSFNCVFRIEVIKQVTDAQTPNIDLSNYPTRKNQILTNINPSHPPTFRYKKAQSIY